MDEKVAGFGAPEHTLSRRSFIRGVATSVGMALAGNVLASCGALQDRESIEDVARLSLSEAAGLVRRRRVSPVELTRASLERIEKLNPALNAFIRVTSEEAMESARAAEAEISRGRWLGPLHGIPIGLKDNIDTAGIPTTAGSAVFLNRVPAADADVVRRLKAAGAVLVGKLNLDEFAFGHTSTLSHFGPVHNPWKHDHITGGSSGGAGAAVAAHLCYGALGTDTGGSIRIPAAYCGIVGLRPTPGLVSTRGCVPLSWTLDTIGPMARSVGDLARMLSVIAGHDAGDAASVSAPAIDYVTSLGRSSRSVRVGTAKKLFANVEDQEVRAALAAALDVLRSLGVEVHDVDLPVIPEGTFGNILLPEARAFHAPLLAKAANLYHPIVRRRAEFGATVGTSSYIQARRDLDRLRTSVGRQFEEVDLILAPAFYTTIPTIAEDERDQKIVGPPPALPTGEFSVLGLPTLSVPCGFTRSGLPVGLQISGPALGEAKVLALAEAYERATPWHRRSPE